MELFNDLVIPVGSSHLTLIRLMLYISSAFLFSYTGLLFGSVWLSTLAQSKAKKNNDVAYQKLAQDLINVGTGIPGMWFGLGLVPMLSFILSYPQLLSGTEADVVGYLFIALFLLLMGIAASYGYKSAVNFKSVFYSFKTNVKSTSAGVIDDYHHLDEEVENNGSFAAIWSVIFLIVATWFIAGATTYAYDSSLWGASIFDMIFSMNTSMKAILILVMGTALASAIYMFLTFSWQDGVKNIDEHTKNQYLTFARKHGLYAALIIPIVFALQLVTIPSGALSGWMFVFGLLSLLFVLFFAQSVYVTKKKEHVKGIKFGFMFILVAFAMFAAQDQQAFHIAVSGNLHAIAEVAEEEEAARLALYESEDNKPQVDAQAIFETRCIACHKFDVKQPTAPAYNDVIPKYEGNEAELVKFILNPYPVNPTDYPAGMANQGLSPAEGKAMAKWLLDKVVGGGDSEEAKPETEEEAPATEEEATASAE